MFEVLDVPNRVFKIGIGAIHCEIKTKAGSGPAPFAGRVAQLCSSGASIALNTSKFWVLYRGRALA